MDARNRSNVKEAIPLLQKTPGGAWFLCEFLENPSLTQRNMEPSNLQPAPNRGLIVWKD